MSYRALVAAVAVLLIVPAAKADTFLCRTTKGEASRPDDLRMARRDIGERFILGTSAFDDVTVIHQSGASPVWTCKTVGPAFVCHFATINRDAIFDARTRTMTMPVGFSDGYTEATCEPIDLSSLPMK